MNLIDYDKFQIIDSFKKINIGDQVCSKRFGIGIVSKFHNKEVIVDFGSYQHRFAEDEKELREFHGNNLKKKISNKINIEVNGQKMTLREIKRMHKIEKQLEKILN